MSKVGEGARAGFLTPDINRPDSFTVSGPITTESKAVFFLKGGENITVIQGKTDDARLIGDSGNLPEFPFESGTTITSGDSARGQRILNTGTTSGVQRAGDICVQPQGTGIGPWLVIAQDDIDFLNTVAGVKSNEGDDEPVFIREGCVGLSENASIGKAFVTSTGTATDWTSILGNIFQVGYGLGDASGSSGKGFYADFTQQARYPLDYLDKDARWFAFSTRRLSYEADLCMTVYRDDDPTDTADIGWDDNGNINTTQILTFAAGANVRVKTWYNQSGNGYHAVADTSSSVTRGPEIWTGSGFTTLFGGNNRVALKFDGAQFMVADTGGSGDIEQPLWCSTLGSYDDYTVATPLYWWDGDSANRTTLLKTSGTVTQWFAGSVQNIGTTGVNPLNNNDDNHIIVTFNGADSFSWVNNTQYDTDNVGTGNNDGMTIGARYTFTNPFEGTIAEIVMFAGNTSMAVTDAWISRFITQTNNFYDLY